MSEPDEPWDRLTFRADGFVYLKPCRQIIFYWSGSVFDRADAIVDLYEQSRAFLQSQARFFRTETMSSARPLKKDSFDLLPFWLKETSTRRQIYGLSFESGSAPDEPSDAAFSFSALEFGPEAKGYVRVVVPVAFKDEPENALADLALRLGRNIDFSFGQAGYSMNWNELGEYRSEAMESMLAVGRRYPGIDLPYPSTTLYALASGIKCADWLTLLNLQHVERLGGVDAIRSAVGGDIGVQTMRHGAILQAGLTPGVGDVNRREALPAYHRVGKLLAPLRSSHHPAFIGRDGIPSGEASRRWLGRFDV